MRARRSRFLSAAGAAALDTAAFFRFIKDENGA